MTHKHGQQTAALNLISPKTVTTGTRGPDLLFRSWSATDSTGTKMVTSGCKQAKQVNMPAKQENTSERLGNILETTVMPKEMSENTSAT